MILTLISMLCLQTLPQSIPQHLNDAELEFSTLKTTLRSETCVCVWKYMLLHLSCGVRSLPHHTLYGVREMGLLNARGTIWKSASLTRYSRPLHEGAWKVVLSAVNAKILKLSAKIRQMKTFPETESTKRAWKCRDLALKRFEWRQL